MTTSSKTPPKVKAEKSPTIDWDTSPLFKEGTKSLSINTDNTAPTINGATKPCVDAKTGKPREFLAETPARLNGWQGKPAQRMS